MFCIRLSFDRLSWVFGHQEFYYELVCSVGPTVFYTSRLDFRRGLAGPLCDDGNICISYLECGHRQKTGQGVFEFFRLTINFERVMDAHLFWTASDWFRSLGDYHTMGGYPDDDLSFLESIETGRFASLTLYTLGKLCCCFKRQPVSLEQIVYQGAGN